MTDFMNGFNKVFSLFFCIMLLLTGGINSIFTGEVKNWESQTSVVGLETLTRSQDVTTDGEYFYFSGKTSLQKVSLDGKEIVAINTKALDNELGEKFNSQHIGGISYYNGIIYAACEDSKQWQYPVIALFDADTLEYTGKCFLLPTSLQSRGVPWVAVDGENGVAFTGDSRNYTEIYKFSLEDFSYVETVALSSEVQKIQGGEISDGKLFAGTNDMTRACYTVDLETGEVNKLFDRIMYEYKLIDNFGGEGEGLTLLSMEDGTYIHTLQLGALFIDSSLRHYKYQ
ncbi:MAG: hypothetical protein E7535_00355 [Ruminococcaceae bacterium]|nr:hypothetical protein [Oscillospiraceae bacterium]